MPPSLWSGKEQPSRIGVGHLDQRDGEVSTNCQVESSDWAASRADKGFDPLPH